MTKTNRLRTVTVYKSWIIGSALLGLLIVAVWSVLVDFESGIPIGSTIIETLKRPESVAILVTGAFLVGWFWIDLVQRSDRDKK